MKVPFLDLHWQHVHIKEALQKKLDEIFETSSFIGGKFVLDFEDHFAKYIGVTHCIGVANGTDALILALKALGIGQGDEVITIPNTFFASASSIAHVGATPIFVDIDEQTRNFNFEELEKKISLNTKAIIVVHLYGQPANMDKVLDIAKRNNVKIIEDTCQAQGALYKGQKVGSFGDISVFSFYPGKNLGAYGDAGCICTNDDHYATILKKLRDHGMPKKYVHELIGYNSRLDAIQAVVLDLKLEYLDRWNKLRSEAASMYFEGLKNVKEITLYPSLPETNSVFHLFVIKLDSSIKRDDFIVFMNDNDIATGIHYPFPLHLVPAFSFLGYKEGDLPFSEHFSKQIVSLPIYPGISNEQINHVVAKIKEYVTAS